MRRIPEALVGTTSTAPNKKAIGSKAGKQLGNAVCDRDTTLSKSPNMAKQRSSPKPTQTIRDEGMESQPSGKSAPTGDRASKRNASACSTHVVSKKSPAEDTVTCKICQQNLPVTEFSEGKLKKLRKAKAKGNSMQIVCTTCTMSNADVSETGEELRSHILAR